MRHPDIYVGQANTSGYLETLQRAEHGGFVYYRHKRVWTHPHNQGPISLYTARCLRREWIEDKKTVGFTVKGVGWVSLDLIAKLNRCRFEEGARICRIEDLHIPEPSDRQFVLIRGFYLNRQDIVFGPEFGGLYMGSINRAIAQKQVFTALPRFNAEEI